MNIIDFILVLGIIL